MNSLRLLFMGTPDFALPALDLLHCSSHTLAAIVTRPDRLSGRGKALSFSAVKKWALDHNLKTYQPDKLSEEAFLRWLDDLKPDLIVTVAFGRMLSNRLLQTPPLGCINLHASYLPAYRGAAPIHRAVMDGAEYSGVSIIELTGELDGGDLYSREKEMIRPEDTAGSLHERLAERGADLLLRTINALARGAATKEPQDPSLASYAPSLSPPDEIIDWNRSSKEIYNQVRGLNPWPGAYTTFRGKRVKIWETAFSTDSESTSMDFEPGTIIKVSGETIEVATGTGRLTLVNLQPAGKKQMEAVSFCCGYRIEPGDCLGAE
jgi:methionyl-tRNA formyltransferase